jgi:hypothetical protein
MFTINKAEAMQADLKSARIAQKGAYVGVFSRAEIITSKKGTKGVGFTFDEESGLFCSFDLWTEKSDGSKLSIGTSAVMAIMAVLNVKQTTIKPTVIEKWNGEIRGMDQVEAECLPELMNKKLGLMLFMEEYLSNDGAIKQKASLFAPFQHDTKLLATEVLNQVTAPAMFEKMYAAMQDKKLATIPSGGRTASESHTVFYDDEVPF